MKRWILVLLALGAVAGLPLLLFTLRTSPRDPVQRGAGLFAMHCATCHGPSGDGRGPAAYLLYPRPRDLRAGVFKVRSTPSGSLPTDQDLHRIIENGMPGTSMLSWAWLPEADREALVAFVKTLSPRFTAEEPAPAVVVPAAPPSTPDLVAEGGEVYTKYGCAKCHGATGRGDGPASATLRDDKGLPIKPYDFTLPGRYKGGGMAGDVYRTFVTGFDGTPMPSFADAIPEADRWPLVYFVMSLSAGAASGGPGSADVLGPGAEIPVHRTAEVPLDPLAPEWSKAKPVAVELRPLYAATQAPGAILVSALEDQENVGLKLTWSDASSDAATFTPQDFRDGAAVQFALTDTLPFFGMGARGAPVNIWHWKADWQSDIAARLDMAQAYPSMAGDAYSASPELGAFPDYQAARDAGNPMGVFERKTPMEDLNAAGLGTITPQPAQAQQVMGSGVFHDGQWQVAFVRARETPDDGDRQFDGKASKTSRGGRTGRRLDPDRRGVPVAFAVWDGSHEERNGTKRVTGWYWLVSE